MRNTKSLVIALVFSKTRSTSIRGTVSTTKFNESYDSDESTYNVIRAKHMKLLVLWYVYERLILFASARLGWNAMERLKNMIQ